jgi:hypothetical protein
VKVYLPDFFDGKAVPLEVLTNPELTYVSVVTGGKERGNTKINTN